MYVRWVIFIFPRFCSAFFSLSLFFRIKTNNHNHNNNDNRCRAHELTRRLAVPQGALEQNCRQTENVNKNKKKQTGEGGSGVLAKYYIMLYICIFFFMKKERLDLFVLVLCCLCVCVRYTCKKKVLLKLQQPQHIVLCFPELRTTLVITSKKILEMMV